MFPRDAVDTDGFQRYEPLLTPTLVRQRYLLGLPTQSFFINPITKKRDVITDPMLEDFIKQAVNEAEMILKIDIFPVQRRGGQPYDRNHFVQFGYFRMPHKPIASVDKLSIELTNNATSYDINTDWIDNRNFNRGLIYSIPFGFGASSTDSAFVVPGGEAVGAMFAAMMTGNYWMPAYFTILYTTGFPNGQLPYIINDLIGTIVACHVLGLIFAWFFQSSYSLSLDGMSQSQSLNPQILQNRLDGLLTRKEELAKQIRGLFGRQIMVSTI
jgi:hypothetical protein